MRRAGAEEYDAFYQGYVSLVPEVDVVAALERQGQDVRDLAARIAPDRETYRYQPGKWSVREVLGHMVDAERVFGYRAFCIGRGDQTSLPGFDENAYVETSPYAGQPVADLAALFAAVRAVNVPLFRGLTEADWDRTGTANGVSVSVRGLAYILVGHARHHLQILRTRYGA